jgi:hypothetical protein
VKPDADKTIRAERLYPRFKTHGIKFQTNQLELKKQLILHPDYPFMDLKDALAYGQGFCYPPGTVAPVEYKKENWRLRRAASDAEMDEEYQDSRRKLLDDENALDEMEK